MKADKYCFDGSKKLDLNKVSTNSKKDKVTKEDIVKKTAQNQAKIAALQERLYADGREGVILVLQAIDAAGKDSTVKHVMSGINPQGVQVTSFKQPNSEELSHDFLWRVNKHLPSRGMIGIFNRSYYEDVLVVQVHNINKSYHMAERVVGMDDDKFFQKRYAHIRNYEEYLYDNSYRIVKIFLNVSKDKQKERFIERIDTPEKNWKFSSSDCAVREQWDKYDEAYEACINATATKENPWYIIPADQKWYSRYLISEAILKALEAIDPQYPVLSDDEAAKLADCKATLLAEDDGKSKAKAAKTEKAETKEKKEKKAKAEKTPSTDKAAKAEKAAKSEKKEKKGKNK